VLLVLTILALDLILITGALASVAVDRRARP